MGTLPEDLRRRPHHRGILFQLQFLHTRPGIAPASTSAPFAFTPAVVAAIILGIVAVIVVAFLAFYLVTRLRFALFHCLIHQTKELKPTI